MSLLEKSDCNPITWLHVNVLNESDYITSDFIISSLRLFILSGSDQSFVVVSKLFKWTRLTLVLVWAQFPQRPVFVREVTGLIPTVASLSCFHVPRASNIILYYIYVSNIHFLPCLFYYSNSALVFFLPNSSRAAVACKFSPWGSNKVLSYLTFTRRFEQEQDTYTFKHWNCHTSATQRVKVNDLSCALVCEWVWLHVEIRKVWRGGLLALCEVGNGDWPLRCLPIDPHYSSINRHPGGLDCHQREWKHMQQEMHPGGTEGTHMITKFSVSVRNVGTF